VHNRKFSNFNSRTNHSRAVWHKMIEYKNMFHIVLHCKPKKENEEFYGKVIGAYVSVLIDYKDYDGVMKLAKFYIEQEEWIILDKEDEYYTFNDKEDLPNDYQQYFDEIIEYGYSIIFNTYDDEE
jgi:hypothetical protein